MVLTILGKSVPCLGPLVLLKLHQVILPGHLVDDRSKIGGPVELHCAQALEVALQHTLNARTVGVLIIVVLSGKMTCWAGPMQGTPSSALIQAHSFILSSLSFHAPPTKLQPCSPSLLFSPIIASCSSAGP